MYGELQIILPLWIHESATRITNPYKYFDDTCEP